MKIRTLDFMGDTVVDVGIDLAKMLFEQAVENGKMAYAVTSNQQTHLTKFDPKAKEVVIIPNYAGG